MARQAILPLTLALVVAAALIGTPADSSADLRHISLVRSAPAKDTVVASAPAEIRLWFNGVPRDGATSIRLLGASGEPVTSVHVMDAAPDPQDGRVQFAQIHGTLSDGRYRVAWSTVAQDGATASGEIPFSLRTR